MTTPLTIEEREAKLKKLIAFEESKSMAIFDELQDILDVLKNIESYCKTMSEKELVLPEGQKVPEIKMPDMAETNKLLQMILDKKEKEREDIIVELKIT